MSEIVLPNTSLCAIVRDEKMNPAGGIVDFLDSTMPFVEAGVIVDTGSKDGTRELLEELEAKYPNLKILDREFDGYASSRNFSLDNVETGRVLILDADERLTRNDFSNLYYMIHRYGPHGFAKVLSFDFLDVYPDGVLPGEGQCKRLFINSPHLRFITEVGKCWEVLEDYFLEYPPSSVASGIKIKHFMPPGGIKDKMNDWYPKMHARNFSLAPSEIPSFAQWKTYNPRREDYC